MSNRVRLDGMHSAVMFISTKCFSIEQEKRIKKIIDEKLGKNCQFVGRCFGKFDIIVEFQEESAKVASYKACTVQESATEMITEENKQIKEHPICSSLVLCNEFIDNRRTERSLNKLPIRFYSFLLPKKPTINLDRVLKEVTENMRLFFSSSYFTFLLIISGDTFYRVFDVFREFRENTKDSFSESSTHVAIDWENEDKSSEEKINANVLIKLKEGFGDINDIKVDEFIKSKNKRFGSFDISLLAEAETLSDMKQKILKLRENRRISHTSTSLLIMEAKNGTSRREP